MPEDDDKYRLKHELIAHQLYQLYQLSLAQTEALMEISHALRTDQNVSESTRADAERAWTHVKSMIDTLKTITKTNNALFEPEGSSDE